MRAWILIILNWFSGLVSFHVIIPRVNPKSWEVSFLLGLVWHKHLGSFSLQKVDPLFWRGFFQKAIPFAIPPPFWKGEMHVIYSTHYSNKIWGIQSKYFIIQQNKGWENSSYMGFLESIPWMRNSSSISFYQTWLRIICMWWKVVGWDLYTDRGGYL